ncbi:unnamed protein product [Blepharisma stoltei]|uniref:Dolichyl-diphosphooligosaccharide--protein glycosyltransferase subunit 1 n=1 Tax=Blepharisma stoltei TaxID=1481888 RepID=A0AAU9IK27_9CILI|nr:unnamed protein product [Blepharisma stoltei]
MNMALFILLGVAVMALDTSGFTNTYVDRVIDLTGRYSHSINTITVLNHASSSVSKYYYAISKDNYEKLAHIRAYFKDEPHNLFKIDHVPEESTSQYELLKITIPRGIASKAETDLIVEEILAQKLEPYPSKIGIFDPQLLWFEDNIHLLSPYKTKSSRTRVSFPTQNIESYTQPEDMLYDLKGKELTYGQYSDLPAFANLPLQLHFENSNPLPYFTRVERQIEVSHWGNIAISEFYNIINRGAELKGEFSRVDLSHRYKSAAQNALESLQAILPKTSWGLSYRDELGNVSTSRARQHPSYVHLEVMPRFPMLGGWKSNWNIGYNLPMKYFVKNKGDQYMLNTTFGFPFKEIIAEELIVKVILPEGATDIDVALPFEIDHKHFETLHSYLDTTGRPVLVLTKKNAVDYHRKPFQVIYKFSSVQMMREPLMISGIVLCAMLLLIFYYRFDLALDKTLKKLKTE